jgi:hypothetical protein
MPDESVEQNSPAFALGPANETKASVHSAAADAVITFEIIPMLLFHQGVIEKLAALALEMRARNPFDNSEQRK